MDLWSIVSGGTALDGTGSNYYLFDFAPAVNYATWKQHASTTVGQGYIENPYKMVNCWSSTADLLTTACDTGLSRDAAATVDVGNGTLGDKSGTVKAANETMTGTSTLATVTATSMLATGNVDGTAPMTITTGTTATLGGTFRSGYTYNQEATAATAVAYTLPTAAAGRQYCVGNSWNGSAATTGVLTVNTSASGQFIIFTDGTLSATGGNVTSGGAAADAACFVGVDATHWQQYTQRGTWTKH